MTTPAERYARFKDWLAHMSQALDDWLDALPDDVRDRLDFSLESLEFLEAYLIERFATVKAAFSADDGLFIDGAARYFGETLIRCLGGRWDIDENDPNSIAFGVPSVRGLPRPGPPLIPLSVLQNAIEGGSGDYFAFIIKYAQPD